LGLFRWSRIGKRQALWLALGLAAGLLPGPWLLADERTRGLAWNTAWLAGSVTALSLPLGTILAALLLRTELPGRKLALAVLASGLFVPLFLQAGAWQAGFGLQGWVPLATGTPPWLDGWTAAIWIHTVAAVPWVVLIVGAALRAVEPELEEQALLEAGPARVFWTVTLRRSLAGLAAAGLWVAVGCAAEMTVTDLYRVRTYAEELYTQLAVTGDAAEASLAVLPGIALTSWLVLAGVVLAGLLGPVTHTGPRRAPPRINWGREKWPLAGGVWLTLAILAGVPLLNLLHRAGIQVELGPDGRIRTWSAWKCGQLILESVVQWNAANGTLQPGRFLSEFGWSLGIGSLAATLAVAVAMPLAWGACHGGWKSSPAILLTAICVAVPAPLLGLLLIGILNRPELPGLVFLYDRSILAPLLAQALRAGPLAVLVLWHAFRSVPAETLDLAACDGLGPLGQLLWTAWPQRRGAVLAAWLVSLAVAVGELGASILVVPPRVSLLSVRLWTLLHSGVDDFVAAIFVALLVLLAALTGLGTLALARLRPRHEG